MLIKRRVSSESAKAKKLLSYITLPVSVSQRTENYGWIDYRMEYVKNRVKADFQSHSVISSSIIDRQRANWHYRARARDFPHKTADIDWALPLSDTQS